VIRQNSVILTPEQLIQGRQSRLARTWLLCIVGRLKPQRGGADIGNAATANNAASPCRLHRYAA